jgi:dihydroxyacetone kinase-like protein
VDVDTLRQWLCASAASIQENRDYLTQLDAAIGDADHGVNMSRGFTEMASTIAEGGDAQTPGGLLTMAGNILFSAVGGASGALWGFAMQRAGRVLGDNSNFDGAKLAGLLEEALAGVMELGAAEEGDKTMVDALAPAARSIRKMIESGATVAQAATAAREDAEAGMFATMPLRANRGRASYLGDRGIGHKDPGAMSTVLILGALESTLAKIS